MRILAINAGSSSVRLGAYASDYGHVECLWNWHESISDDNPEKLLRRILKAKQSEAFDIAVHRLVHGGTAISGPSFADKQTKAAVEALVPLAPLHNRPFLTWLKAAELVLGPRVAHVMVPDTGFYANLPDRARRYALPAKLCDELGIRRFGFHGLAHESMVRTWHAMASPPEAARLISFQLGSGCSVTATRGKEPVDTSMGYTPLEGLVMATRAGDLDPGIVLHLMQTGLDQDSISALLNHQSGLLGLSGISGDMRDLLSSSSSDARRAVEVYCYRARKYFGAYLAVLGGVDAILFGGGVGENSPEIRAEILHKMDWLGIEIDEDQNLNKSGSSPTRMISTEQSRIAVWVISVDEERLMAQAAYELDRRYRAGVVSQNRSGPTRRY